jgi:hypothetical protein
MTIKPENLTSSKGMFYIIHIDCPYSKAHDESFMQFTVAIYHDVTWTADSQ